MTIVSGWCDWAIRVPRARQDKVYPEHNGGHGIVWHSQEGYGLATMVSIQQGDKPPSFMFYLALTGVLYQFSPVTASVWCSGNREANTFFWPVELEGTKSEPINDEQMRSAMRLIADWEQVSGLAAEREVTMWEHREVATRWSPNAGPTACPSERYAPLWEVLNMTLLERLERVERLVAGYGYKGLTGESALAAADMENVSALQFSLNLNDAMTEHIENHPVGMGGAVYNVTTGTLTMEAQP